MLRAVISAEMARPCELTTDQGVLTLTQGFDDEGEVEEREKDNIELVEAGEDAAEALKSAEEPLNLIASAVHGAIVLPGFQAIVAGRRHGNPAEIERQLPGLVIFIGAVHQEIERRR